MEKIIKFDGFADGKDWIAYKYPEEESWQDHVLVVNPSQEAVLIKNGSVADWLTSGTHALNEILAAEEQAAVDIFYVNKAVRLDLKWGTANPFQIEDPKYSSLVTIRAHGKYGIKLADASLFIGELVGSAPAGATFSREFIDRYFKDMLMSYIKSTISAFMISNRISFLEITPYLVSLSKECNRAVAKEFERYGVEIINLCIETISPLVSDLEKLSCAQTAEPRSSGEGLSYAVCPRCQANVPAGQRFCGNCGAPMKKKCDRCGAEWDAAQKFCGDCGTRLD